jgi:hypothetical protein
MFQRGRYGLNQGKEEGRLRLALFSCVEITMPKEPFFSSDFAATKFSTAADKAEFGNTLLRFIESEWASALFTKGFYNRLSTCYGHIAHYVEGLIMRSACVNTLWIQSLTTSSQCIIPTFALSAVSQLPGGRSPHRNVKVCIPAARFALWRFCMNASHMAGDSRAGRFAVTGHESFGRLPSENKFSGSKFCFRTWNTVAKSLVGLCRFETNPQLCATLTTHDLITRLP